MVVDPLGYDSVVFISDSNIINVPPSFVVELPAISYVDRVERLMLECVVNSR